MFLANENFPRPSIKLLREKGFTIKSIQEEFPGIPDEIVMDIASEMNLIILTFDSDYGEMIFKHKRDNPPTVIYFRDKGSDPLFAGHLLFTYYLTLKFLYIIPLQLLKKKNIRQRFYKK